MTSAAVHSNIESWGLDRIDQVASTQTLDRSFTFPDHGGGGVLVYAMDTGVQANLPGFEGRVAIGFQNNLHHKYSSLNSQYPSVSVEKALEREEI
jgi:hypothetical protein